MEHMQARPEMARELGCDFAGKPGGLREVGRKKDIAAAQCRCHADVSLTRLSGVAPVLIAAVVHRRLLRAIMRSPRRLSDL
jgi:hypothetical protein